MEGEGAAVFTLPVDQPLLPPSDALFADYYVHLGLSICAHHNIDEVLLLLLRVLPVHWKVVY